MANGKWKNQSGAFEEVVLVEIVLRDGIHYEWRMRANWSKEIMRLSSCQETNDGETKAGDLDLYQKVYVHETT